MEQRLVTLDTINSGAAIDLFEEEFEKLLKNVADDNTEASKERSITVTLKVKPSKTREQAVTTVSVTSRLAPLKPHESLIVLSNDGSKIQAFALSPEKQEDLPGIENVRQFPPAAGGK